MSERRIRVAVVYGGRSSEHGISAVSAGSVLGALDPDRYDVVTVGITRDGRWVLTDADREQLAIRDRHVPEVKDGVQLALPLNPAETTLVRVEPGTALDALGAVDVVFPVLHGRFGEDGTIQGLLEMAGIPYVGAGVFASAAAMDKEYTKKLLRAEGLDVGTWRTVRRGQRVSVADLADLPLPVFVKPARAGSSVGISKVRDWSELPDALELAFAEDDKALIEQGVAGREVECGVLEDERGEPQASLPAEILLHDGVDWYDFDAKYLDASDYVLPADLPDAVTEEIRRTACTAFTALDGRGLARVDFFVTPDERVVVNEVNTMPGFTEISMYPKMWAATGVPYPELLDRLVRSALRHAGRCGRHG